MTATTPKPHPGYRQLDMTALIALDPHRAKAEILRAYKRAGCSLSETGRYLEGKPTERTLHRWVDKLEMREQLAKATEDAIRDGVLNAKRRAPGSGGVDAPPRRAKRSA